MLIINVIRIDLIPNCNSLVFKNICLKVISNIQRAYLAVLKSCFL